MKPLDALLDRFRRTAAVPAAVADDLSAELAPVFAALEEIEAAAAEVRAEADRRARERIADAGRQSARIESGRRDLAEEARAEAAAERRRRAEAEAEAVVTAAEAEADRVRAAGRDRVGPLADAVAACVLERA